jgi:hypothetical protein
MNDRRSFVIGVGGAILGTAAFSNTAAGAADEGTYAVGLVWSPDLGGPFGRLRLNVYLAVGEAGAGTGYLSDPVHPNVNSHLDVQRTVGDGPLTEFHGEISRSTTPAFVGQPFVIRAAINADGGTVLALVVGSEVFSGLGRVFRITNIRGNASAIGTSVSFLPIA